MQRELAEREDVRSHSPTGLAEDEGTGESYPLPGEDQPVAGSSHTPTRTPEQVHVANTVRASHQASELPVERTLQTRDTEWRTPLGLEVGKTVESTGRLTDWIRRLQREVDTNTLNDVSLDLLYDDLILILRRSTREQSKNPSSSSNAERPHKGHSRNRRGQASQASAAAKKRYAFARCQMLWDNCPSKLAGVVMANDLSFLQKRQLPSRADVTSLYNELWGQSGSNAKPLDGHEELIPASTILTPITPDEVRKRIVGIKNSSAAGPDGLLKTDLSGTASSEALATP